MRQAARQEQFLEVVSAEEARARFERHLDLTPLPANPLRSPTRSAACSRTISLPPTDVPPFDRAGVDGFALRADDTVGATDAAPRRLALNAEVLACGRAPSLAVAPGTATAIATGGVVPRGADAVIMIEHTELIETPHGRRSTCGARLRRASSCRMRAPTSRAARPCCATAPASARARSACSPPAASRGRVVRRPKVAVLSTGDELVQPGDALRPGAVYDSNGAIVAAAVAEAGGDPVPFGAFPDDEAQLEAAVRRALDCDMVVLSGGTSKGAGDLSYRIISRLGAPGVVVHGVALKPGKPLCLAVVDGKPIVVLPGFPTSAIFTFHAFVAPVIRARAGLGREAVREVEAAVPVRIASELGRKEFVLVSLVAGEEGLVAFPSPKGSGAVTSFSQSDGFIEVDALTTAVDAGTPRARRADRAGERARPRRHGQPLRGARRRARRARRPGLTARTIAVGSQGGVAAARRGECDLAPVHLIDPATGTYNAHLLTPGIGLVRGWQRMQGILYRAGRQALRGARRRAARGRGGGRGRARRSVLPHGQPQRRGRHARPDRPAARRQAAARLRQPAALAQCGRGRGRAGRAPIGAWRSSRSPVSMASASCSSRPSATISSWSNGGASGRPCRRSWRRCRMRPCASASARSACGRTRSEGRVPDESLRSDRDGRARDARRRSPASAQLRGHGGPVRAVAVSPDGTVAISGSFDSSAIRWSLTRNAAEQVLRFHESAVNAVASLRDGRIVTAGEDGRIAIWNAGEPKPATVLEGHTAPIAALAVSPDGATIASASWDRTIRLWPLGRRRAARARGPSAERQRRRVHARRPRAGERRL